MHRPFTHQHLHEELQTAKQLMLHETNHEEIVETTTTMHHDRQEISPPAEGRLHLQLRDPQIYGVVIPMVLPVRLLRDKLLRLQSSDRKADDRVRARLNQQDRQ